jgi:putative DNA primase/helicase
MNLYTEKELTLTEIENHKKRHITCKDVTKKIDTDNSISDTEFFSNLITKKALKKKADFIMSFNDTEYETEKKCTFRVYPPDSAVNSQESTLQENESLKDIDIQVQSKSAEAATEQNIKAQLPYVAPKLDGTSCNDIADTILVGNKFMFLSGSLYVYSKPRYQRLNDHDGITMIRTLLPERMRKKLNTNQLNEILRLIKTTPEIQKSIDQIPEYKNSICFRNKVYNLSTKQLEWHSPNNYFFSCVNADYDPYNVEYGATFEMYLNTCTGGDKTLRELILQVIGYIVSNSMDAKAFFIAVGEKNAGKSKLGELLQGLLGNENSSHVPLQDLPKRFQVAELCGKKLNTSMELSNTPIKDIGMIKLLTSGGDIVPAEEKYMKPFSFVNKCKLLYGCNNLPPIHTSESTNAFFDRLVLIPFQHAVEPHLRDKELVAKLLKEKNYILHKSIQALDRLKANNYIFPQCKSTDDLKGKYFIDSNSVLQFVNERCVVGDEDLVSHGLSLYSNYVEFCNERGYDKNNLFNYTDFRNILYSSFKIDYTRSRKLSGNKNCIIGIALKEPLLAINS